MKRWKEKQRETCFCPKWVHNKPQSRIGLSQTLHFLITMSIYMRFDAELSCLIQTYILCICICILCHLYMKTKCMQHCSIHHASPECDIKKLAINAANIKRWFKFTHTLPFCSYVININILVLVVRWAVVKTSNRVSVYI